MLYVMSFNYNASAIHTVNWTTRFNLTSNASFQNDASYIHSSIIDMIYDQGSDLIKIADAYAANVGSWAGAGAGPGVVSNNTPYINYYVINATSGDVVSALYQNNSVSVGNTTATTLETYSNQVIVPMLLNGMFAANTANSLYNQAAVAVATNILTSTLVVSSNQAYFGNNTIYNSHALANTVIGNFFNVWPTNVTITPIGVASAVAGSNVTVQFLGSANTRLSMSLPYSVDANYQSPPGQRMSIIGNTAILQGVQNITPLALPMINTPATKRSIN